MHVPHQIRWKMGDKTQPGTLIGYGDDTKGYRVLVRGQITLSRDVRLNEELRGPEEMGSW